MNLSSNLILLGVLTMHFYKLLGLKTQIRPKYSINKIVDNISFSEILFDEIILNRISCIGKKVFFFFKPRKATSIDEFKKSPYLITN